MRNGTIVRFVCELVKSWDRRRALSMARLVCALMHSGRLGVAAIGRYRRTATNDKHNIKAVDRFLGNKAVDLPSAFASLAALVSAGRRRIFVLLDWTDLHDGQRECLVAAVSFGGRSVPVAWATYEKGRYLRSRNSVEVALCKLVKALLPPDVELVIVSDRGFGRASFFKALKRARIRFVVRIRKDVHIIDRRGDGPVRNRAIQPGKTRDLQTVDYSDNSRVEVRCVITFGEGTGKNRPTQPWYLVTDLSVDELPAQQIVAAYKLRMRIEHSFRDFKSLRFGFQLRSVRLTKSARYDRLLLIAAVALLLLVLIGLSVECRNLHRTYKANTDPSRTHSLFQLGLAFLNTLRVEPTPRFLRACCDVHLAGMG